MQDYFLSSIKFFIFFFRKEKLNFCWLYSACIVAAGERESSLICPKSDSKFSPLQIVLRGLVYLMWVEIITQKFLVFQSVSLLRLHTKNLEQRFQQQQQHYHDMDMLLELQMFTWWDAWETLKEGIQLTHMTDGSQQHSSIRQQQHRAARLHRNEIEQQKD